VPAALEVLKRNVVVKKKSPLEKAEGFSPCKFTLDLATGTMS
jgi:hypothetical protein